MNRLSGIPTLNAGAVDLRLSGDQTQRGSYVQRRRAQMAGGGITQIGKPGGLVEPGISGYGMLDFITKPLGKLKDKIVDDIIPNELKNPAVLATLAGVGLNQFGLPNIPGMGKIGLEKGMGQNWLGNILGQDLVFGPGGEQFPDYSNVTGVVNPNWQTPGINPYQNIFQTGAISQTPGNLGQLATDAYKNIFQTGAISQTPFNRQALEQMAKQQTEKTGLAKIWDQIKGGASSLLGDTTRASYFRRSRRRKDWVSRCWRCRNSGRLHRRF